MTPLARRGLDRAALRSQIEGLLADGKGRAGAGQALRDLATGLGAAHTVETSLGDGLFTLLLCEALTASGRDDVGHVAIDDNGGVPNAGRAAVVKAGVDDMVELHDRTPELVLSEMLADGRCFDLALVNGDARFEAVFLELYYLHRLVRSQGLIVVDKADTTPVRTAVKYFVTNVGLEVVRSPLGNGAEGGPPMCVLRIPLVHPSRPWWGHFVPFAESDTGLIRSRARVDAQNPLARVGSMLGPHVRRLGGR